MIKINEKGSKAIDTGENISEVLSTFIETGPKDELSAIDGYRAPSPDALEKLKGTDCECDTPASEVASSSGLFGGSGGSGSGGSGASDTNGEGGIPGTNGLWTALLCGGRSGVGRNTIPTGRQAAAVSLWMRLLGCSASDILKLVDTRSGEPQINVGVLQSRLSNALGQSINELSSEDKERLVSNLKNEEESQSGDSEVEEDDSTLSIGGVKRAFSAVSLDDAKSFAKLLQSSGDDEVSVEVEDNSSKSQIQLATFDKAIKMNDPESFGRIASNIERTPKNRRLFLGKTNDVAKSGNLEMMNHLLDIVGVDMVLSRYPDILRDIIRYYVIPKGLRPSQALPELLTTLNRIDSGWNSSGAYGASQSDIEPYTWCSPDAESVFMSSDDHRTQVMIASSYRSTDKRTLINQYHDYFAMTA
tara:strand:- start:3102 stop:4352 length:1251 start_codon:yes stop_codon:yes gene_type:complete